MLVFLTEAGAWGAFPSHGLYHENLEALLRVAYGDFCAWKKQSKVDANQPRFSPARVNRRVRASWACLNSKAAAGKAVSFFLSAKAAGFARRAAATELDKRVATCMWTYVELLRIMDEGEAILAPPVAAEFFEKGMLHLQLYSALRHQSSRTLGAAAPMRYLFQLIPKHHYMMHMLYDVAQTAINPRFFTLLCAESWVGLVGRLSRTCHRSSLSRRALQRYMVKLGMHIDRVVE